MIELVTTSNEAIYINKEHIVYVQQVADKVRVATINSVFYVNNGIDQIIGEMNKKPINWIPEIKEPIKVTPTIQPSPSA